MSHKFYEEATWICPQCGSETIYVTGVAAFEVTPEGAECVGDIEWDGLAFATCKCGWVGTAGQAADAADAKVNN